MNPPSHHALLPPALTAPAFEREKRSLTRSVFGPVSLAPKQLPQGKRRFTGPRSWPYRFAGGYQGPTGLHHFAARYYDPNTGRFTTPDPSGQERTRAAMGEGLRLCHGKMATARPVRTAARCAAVQLSSV
ncbi:MULTISPECIES: RHS repeat-associated core domain-containing protein [Streptomyces]|nr:MULTISPECIES: RHS repeat-associated core domain-containing protein [Streptomyces]